MDVILNIGLNIQGHPDVTLNAYRVHDVLSANDLVVVTSHTFLSDSEPTLVARVRFNSPAKFESAVFNVSRLLEQDCIAAYDLALDRGSLIGPRASAWGEFNAAFFILLDGSRLSEQSFSQAT